MANGGVTQTRHGGRRRHATQKRATELAGGGQVWATSIFKVDGALRRAGRGGGERIHESGATTENATDGGAVG